MLFGLCPSALRGEEHSQHADCNQGGEKDVGIRQKAACAVAVDDQLGVAQDPRADGGADQPRDKDLTENPDTLELARAVVRDALPNLRAEHGHPGEISRHHQQRADEHRRKTPEKEQQHIPQRQHAERRPYAETVAPPVDHPAVERGDDGSGDDRGCKDENIVVKAKALLVIEQEVGHENIKVHGTYQEKGLWSVD